MDILDTANLRIVVISELEKLNAQQSGQDMLIVCPFHDDTRPSLRIHVGHHTTPGTFHCFACGAKGGWNKLAHTLKLKKVNYYKNDHKKSDNKLHRSLSKHKNGIELFLKEIERQRNQNVHRTKYLEGLEELEDDLTWRGYKGKFYKRLGAKFYWNRKTEIEYLYFPLTISNQYKGYTLCALNPKENTNKYEIHAKAKEVFFLYDYVPQQETIILVEGHFDALRLYALGFFALAIFGVKNWSVVKRTLLFLKRPKKIVIAFDGDAAGYQASQDIYNSLKDAVKPHIFYLPCVKEKLDPGNMPSKYINQLREIVDG